MDTALVNRIAILARLVKSSPTGYLGRTAIMKLLYLLSVIKNVPLGYRFTLYSYGPFDSTVLQDVDFASTLDALQSSPVAYPGGLGYTIQPASGCEEAEALGKDFLDQYEDDIEWVVSQFGTLTATELELASTIVYVDQELVGDAISDVELARKVEDVKPHFQADRILARIHSLQGKGVLVACQ